MTITVSCGRPHLVAAVQSILPQLHLQIACCCVEEAAEGSGLQLLLRLLLQLISAHFQIPANVQIRLIVSNWIGSWWALIDITEKTWPCVIKYELNYFGESSKSCKDSIVPEVSRYCHFIVSLNVKWRSSLTLTASTVYTSSLLPLPLCTGCYHSES